MHTPSRRALLTAFTATAASAAAPASAASAPATSASPSPSPSPSPSKALIGCLYDQLFNQGNLAVVDRLVHPDYIQHSPREADGAAALKDSVRALKAAHPRSHTRVHRILAAGDLVVVHGNRVLTPGTRGDAVFDIFRVERGRATEHWDVVQPVPDTTASGNDMFSTLSTPRRPWPDPRVRAAASRAVATGLFTEVFTERDVTAFDRYTSGPFYQHNPRVPNGTEYPKRFFAQAFTDPHFHVALKRVVADGDYVALHSHFVFRDDRGSAVVDLHRVRDGKVVEHWDALQPVPATAANDNTMF